MTKDLHCLQCGKVTPHQYIKRAKPTTQAEYNLYYVWQCEICKCYQVNNEVEE